MFLILKWRIISWIIVCIGIVLLILNVAGLVPWLPVWVYGVIIVAAYPQLIVIGAVALIAWGALLFARTKKGSDNRWSDR